MLKTAKEKKRERKSKERSRQRRYYQFGACPFFREARRGESRVPSRLTTRGNRDAARRRRRRRTERRAEMTEDTIAGREAGSNILRAEIRKPTADGQSPAVQRGCCLPPVADTASSTIVAVTLALPPLFLSLFLSPPSFLPSSSSLFFLFSSSVFLFISFLSLPLLVECLLIVHGGAHLFTFLKLFNLMR